jgi:hypothetical protein
MQANRRMKMETIDHIFERINNIKWFNNVGNPVQASDFPMVRVHTWQEAKKHYGELVWENTTLEASNILTSFLHDKFQNQYNDWNAVATYAKTLLIDKIRPKIINFQNEYLLDQTFVDCVEWDLEHVMLEYHYSIICRYQRFPHFFKKLLDVYDSGNFPCGWVGEYPEGNLIVL